MDGDLAAAVVGDVAAGVAAVAALFGIRYARQTVREASLAREAAEEQRAAGEADSWLARDAARTARLEAREDADRAHELMTQLIDGAHLSQERAALHRIGDLVEELFWAAERADSGLVPPQAWMDPRNRLGRAVIGRAHKFPAWQLLQSANTAGQVIGFASQMREEVRAELTRLEPP